jgi:hypothetical protein
MDTQDIVERWEKEAELRGVERTLKRNVIDVYELRFGPMPAALRAAVEAAHDERLLDGWLKLAVTRSAEEIAETIRLASAS